MSASRSLGTSEGIHRVSFCAGTYVRAQAIFPRNVHVASDDRLQVVRDAGVRKKILRERRRQVDKQIHITVVPAIVASDRSENRNMQNTARPKFCFVRTEAVEDAC
jgi:hypothetical protein